MKPRFERDGDDAVIRIPWDKVHSVRVAQATCGCKASKSNGTKAVRDWIEKGLARLVATDG